MRFAILIATLLLGVAACGEPPGDDSSGGGNNTGAAGGSSTGGSDNPVGGAGGDPSTGGVGEGGNGGSHLGGAGGAVEPPLPGGAGGSPDPNDCPSDFASMTPNSPCLLQGEWVEIGRSEGRAVIDVQPRQDGKYTVMVTGEGILFSGEFTGQNLPLETLIVDEADSTTYRTVIDLDPETDTLIFRLFRNDQMEGEGLFARS